MKVLYKFLVTLHDVIVGMGDIISVWWSVYLHLR